MISVMCSIDLKYKYMRKINKQKCGLRSGRKLSSSFEYLPIWALPFDLKDCGLDSSENGDNGTELIDCNGEQDGVSE